MGSSNYKARLLGVLPKGTAFKFHEDAASRWYVVTGNKHEGKGKKETGCMLLDGGEEYWVSSAKYVFTAKF